jgi:phosphoribosylaminoimidazole-succinocarboxamide synthase
MSITIPQTDLPLPLFCRGKVRDTYHLDGRLLIVSTDRLSAFDVVLPDPIPDKGKVLNQLSRFWFEKTSHVMPNHLIASVDSTDSLIAYFPDKTTPPDYLVGRSMITLKAERVPVECVVRGYLSGSAWAEYKATGTISGSSVPKGLQESQELPEAIFTPTTKAEAGHDEPLSKKELENLVGKATAGDLEEKSLAVYHYARDYARGRGVIIADTKFEFGFADSRLILIDELLTPDSSRFWDASQYTVGRSQPSFDKQPVRDWLTASGWNKEPPAPALPPEVIEATTRRYREAYQRLTGKAL